MLLPSFIIVRGDASRMPPKEQSSRRSSISSRSEGQGRRPSGVRQLITFVDSQDPNSRSAIQRHTAHHSNAQRRDARLRSLRSNRPRLLEWQRRPSGETDTLSVTSPQSSTSSPSVSPAPGLRATLSAAGDASIDGANATVSSPEKATPPPRSATEAGSTNTDPIVDNGMMQDYLRRLCSCAPRDTFSSVLRYIDGSGSACNCLLSAYLLACKGDETPPQSGSDHNDAQQLYGRGTRLLGARLTNPQTASSDENIQAVLLLIAYASDTGTSQEVQIHLDALSHMITQRGGLEALEAEIDPTLRLQLRTISQSRSYHLTLECGSTCPHKRRFPNGLEILDKQNET